MAEPAVLLVPAVVGSVEADVPDGFNGIFPDRGLSIAGGHAYVGAMYSYVVLDVRRPDAPAVVALHGIPGSVRDFRYLVSSVAAAVQLGTSAVVSALVRGNEFFAYPLQGDYRVYHAFAPMVGILCGLFINFVANNLWTFRHKRQA